MKKLLGIFAVWMMAMSVQAEYVKPNITHEPYGKQKVVYQMNTPNVDMQIQILRNINNHVRAVGADNMDLDVVVFAGGLSALETSKPELVSAIENLRNQGVEFKICNNTLK